MELLILPAAIKQLPSAIGATRAPDLKGDLCSKIFFPDVLHAVITRWNTVTDVIVRGLELQPALDKLALVSRGRSSIKNLLLSGDEWQCMFQLGEVLKPFKDATLRISTNKHPRIFEVIPIIDLLTQFLEGVAKKEVAPVFVHPQDRKAAAAGGRGRTAATSEPTTRKHFDVVRAGALGGLGILDKYYAKTDDSIMYRVAMIMHPVYRQSYFDKQDWPQDWKDQAVSLARAQWNLNYKVELTTVAGTQVRVIRENQIRESVNIRDNWC
ncbi:hypothetical protein GGX14DRAFT_395761 [Mycena pura]|uniref:Uncharacterized protein n=1 Tax=Mycena pura TaxID=153505 RepID=A0AAD6YEB7_9AGAR|nr:hypothetical protein GGX14DRAFT_395761 [Mycena pura]